MLNIGDHKRKSILSGFGKQDIQKLSAFGKILLKAFEGENDKIEKAHLADAFNYGTFKVKKTGKVIKAKLPDIKAEEEKERAELMGEMSALKAQINIEPDEEANDYLFRGTKAKQINIPKLYSWEVRSKSTPSNEGIQQFSTLVEVNKTPSIIKEDTICSKMNKYNEIAQHYIRCGIDIVHIDTLQSVLHDNKEYEFNLEQLSALKF